MILARALLLFSYGLFTIAAQALLFREFLTSFEGNDISVGLFFASWFLWISLGATLAKNVSILARKLLSHIELLFLLYPFAFLLQAALIIQARQLAAVSPYTLMSLGTMLWLSLIINAPLSLLTGLLFPLACRYLQHHTPIPVARVYMLEAAGSTIGGLATTILLAQAVAPLTIFLLLSLILTISALLSTLANLHNQYKLIDRETSSHSSHFPLALATALGILMILTAGSVLLSGTDKTLTHRIHRFKWARLLPPQSYLGSFQTPNAEYHYGSYRGQWVVLSNTGICEALPNRASAGAILALTLAQDPNARSILVVGSGAALCREFLHLPQIQHLHWYHPDRVYLRRVLQLFPPDHCLDDARFRPIFAELRSYLSRTDHKYDLIILNLPDPTSSVLNRYFTLEFYRLLKQTLNPTGLLAVRITAGENIMGTELVNLGASTKQTLQAVFTRTTLCPGDQSWFLASDSPNLTSDPAVLRDRFAQIPNAAQLFSPDALLSLYRPARIEAALRSYASADLPERLLINRDSRPLTHLYSLLLTAKQSDAPVTRILKLITLAALPLFLLPILVWVVLRLIYLKTAPAGPRHSTFDSAYLAFSTGAVAIATVIVLMYLHQTYFASLYLHIGVISSVFMLGLTIGSFLCSQLLSRDPNNTSPASYRLLALLAVVLATHVLVLLIVLLWPIGEYLGGLRWPIPSLEPAHLYFAAVFALSGLCAGCYFPIAARQLAGMGLETGRAAAILETADHLGAATGSITASLLLIPTLGTNASLLVLIALLASNLPANIFRTLKPKTLADQPLTTIRIRKLGYTLLALALPIIIGSNLLRAAAQSLQPNLPTYAAQALARDLQIKPASVTLPRTGKTIRYFSVYKTPNELVGYIFSSLDLAPNVRGFGGKINLAVYVDTTGKLLDFHIIGSNETPSYLELLEPWYRSLIGRNLFTEHPFAGVDAVTGATVSAKAVLAALEQSAQSFATQILQKPIASTSAGKPLYPQRLSYASALYLLAAFAAALLATYFGNRVIRWTLLLTNLLVGGFLLNLQYSTEHIATLLSLQQFPFTLTAVFLLTFGLPVLTVLLGNLYCGYICPFGALQELIGSLLSNRFKHPLDLATLQKARFIKYVMLFVLLTFFFISTDKTTLTVDPLTSAFNLTSPQRVLTLLSRPAALLLIIALAGSLLYSRFWCRYLCPTGAFLALANAIAPLKRLLPAKKFGRCRFGLTPTDQADCIHCDRCRFHEQQPLKMLVPTATRTPPPALLFRCLIPIVTVTAILLTATSARYFLTAVSLRLQPAQAPTTSAGQSRIVDLNRLRTLIKQKRLSDKEALFYHRLDQDEPRPSTPSPLPPEQVNQPQNRGQQRRQNQ